MLLGVLRWDGRSLLLRDVAVPVLGREEGGLGWLVGVGWLVGLGLERGTEGVLEAVVGGGEVVEVG